MKEEEKENASEVSDYTSQHSIPQMIMTGTLKDGGKEGYHNYVPRFCNLRITKIGITLYNIFTKYIFFLKKNRMVEYFSKTFFYYYYYWNRKNKKIIKVFD